MAKAETKTTKTPKKWKGQWALYRGKVRAPVSLTLTPAHHAMVQKAMRRLGLTRADVIGLLIEKHADSVTLDDADAKAHTRVASALAPNRARTRRAMSGEHSE